MTSPLHLRLPATSANLGPGFDALGLAMTLYLDIEATTAPAHRIEATGRNPELVSALRNNLLLDTYCAVAPHAPPLYLRIQNEIPLGMGCGSSAAALLAGVLLASHFGELHLTRHQILEEACHREGHPDNVAACFHGGLTASSMQAGKVTSATLGTHLPWRLLLAVPSASLSTKKARALLPLSYPLADAVANLQSTALLMAAFALNRPELLPVATADRMHQPFRDSACTLLPALLPLAGSPGIHSVTLSGAGPSVLLITDPAAPLAPIAEKMRLAAGLPKLEILLASIASGVVTS